MRPLPENQNKILNFLLDHSEGATLDEISKHLEITNTATKEHLNKIDGLGYLSFVDSKGSVGRPRRRYKLSSNGHDAFPKRYSWFSNEILELLTEEKGTESVRDLMRRLADKVAKTFESNFRGIKNSKDMINGAAALLEELGYRAVVRQNDIRKGAVIEASNCVYHSVAKAHPELCSFDIRLLENISNFDVKLENCIARGDSICRFCLKKRI